MDREFFQLGVVEDLNLGWGLFVVAPGSLSLAERQPGKLVSARTQGFKSLSRRHLSQPRGTTGFLPMYKVKVLTGNQSEQEKKFGR